jgi:hypothetical protein
MPIVVLALFSCEKKPALAPTVPAQPPAGAVAAVRKTATPAAPVAGVASATALLTEEKVKGYVVYTREISSVASEAMGMAGAAFARSKGDKAALERHMARDERAKRLAAASQAALTKSGLTQAEVGVLSQVLAQHYAKRMVAVAAVEGLAKSKAQAKGKPGILDGIYQKQIDEGQAARAEFEKQHGKAALAVVDKYEKDFLEAQEAMLKAAFKRPGK